MRVVVQKVKESSVTINDKIVGKIEKGYTLLVGFTDGDNKSIIDRMVKKIINLRIFEDDNDKMNLDLKTVEGSILSISQFTLYAKLDGRRPSFSDAMKYDEASKMYDYFNEKLKEENVKVETGIFGEDMKVSIINDGPTTIIMDSEDIL